MGLGLLLGLIPVLFNHRFFLKDDMEHQFLPMFYHVGRLLRLGEFPTLTLSSWFGSNIVSEFQFALFNPVSLALNAILPSFTDYEAGAAFLACVYYAILAPGCFVLARTFSIERGWASLLALCITSGNFLSYWGASNWFPMFSSFAWFVWAWAFLRLSLRGRRYWLGAALFCYLTITMGFPYTILLLGFVAALHLVEQFRVDRSWVRALLSVMPLGIALLLSALPLLALVGASSVSSRTSTVFNNGFMMPNLADVLQVSAPLHFGFLKLWHGYGPAETPIFYVAWFLAPLAALLDWRSFNWRQPAVLSLLILGGLVVIAFQGPEEFSLLHFLLRWIPFLHLALLLLFALVVTQVGLVWSRYRLMLAGALIGLAHLTSWQLTPGRGRVLLVSLLICVGAFGMLAMLRQRRAAMLGWAGAVTLLLFTATHGLIRQNNAFEDVNFPRYSSAAADALTTDAPPAYEIVLGPAGYGTNPERAAEFVSGYIFFEQGKSRINGYSAIGHQPLTDLLCMPWNGSTCPEAATRLFAIEPETGQPFVDLFRINSIIAHRGEHLETLLPQLGSEWRLAFDGVYTQRYIRELTTMPGSLAWASPGIAAAQTAPATFTQAKLRVANTGAEPGTLVFARAWWPGYRAELNGTPIAVRAVDGIFTAIDIAAGSNGELRLFYAPPLLTAGLIGVALGLILTLTLLLAYRRLVVKG
ncbi:hypothetical protein [Devosia sp. 1566]|uniref:hypothetical protein n=1 Tax=Devosia sp. 1566 TaxID=2499144 RepID=UPI000FDCABE3|nr:hypothetical protein [Devosia sp. 1566]